jgi:alpha-L-arabinofuranosidase
MKATVLRFPGGLRADAYDWRWGIDNVPGMAPRKERKRAVEGKPISDFIGTDEAIALCRRAKAEPLLVVNVMQFEKQPAEGAALAADWVEYCNSPNDGKNPNGGVDWAAVRAKNGSPNPHNVNLWELGNEIHISGRFPAETYGRMLPVYIKAMKAVDPEIEFLADAETQALREAVVRHAGSRVQYLVHHIYQPWQTSGKGLTAEDGWYGLVSSPHPGFDSEIEDLKRFIKKSGHKYKIALTEWNANGWWEEHAPLRTDYPYAIVMAGMYNSLLRHSDSIPIACSSMLIGRYWAVNIIRADPAERQGTYPTPMYWVAKLYNENHGSELLDVKLSPVPTYATHRSFGSSPARNNVPVTDVAATWTPHRSFLQRIYLHVVNRHTTQGCRLRLEDVRKLFKPGTRLWVDVRSVSGPRITSYNDFPLPDYFRVQQLGQWSDKEDTVVVPARSASVVIVQPSPF